MVNTILKELIPGWNLESVELVENSESVTKSVEEIMESIESDLINFEEDYD